MQLQQLKSQHSGLLTGQWSNQQLGLLLGQGEGALVAWLLHCGA